MKHPERGEKTLIIPNHGAKEMRKGTAEDLKKTGGA
jgi:hypothetical protein